MAGRICEPFERAQEAELRREGHGALTHRGGTWVARYRSPDGHWRTVHDAAGKPVTYATQAAALKAAKVAQAEAAR